MYEEYPQELLVKAVLDMISEHLTSKFDVVRLVAIQSIFDELSPAAKNFVVEHIRIPKSKARFCSMERMCEFQEALRIRAQL